MKESLAKVREGLAKREREYRENRSWYERWFDSSPWSATLLSILIGPLVILLLLLTFGPCILNHLVQYLRQRLSTIQLW